MKEDILNELKPAYIRIYPGKNPASCAVNKNLGVVMNTRICLICGTPITGRADKKFCSDQCRALANNKNKIEAQRNLLVTNQALRRNRTILKTLCPQGKATVRKEVLVSLGYDFNCFTSLFVTRTKQVYYLLYDYGFTPIMEGDVEKALIISRQEYMKEWNPWKFITAV